MNLPSYILAYSWLRIAALAFPRWKAPSGLGAKRVTTFPFSALGSGGRPFFSFLVFFSSKNSG